MRGVSQLVVALLLVGAAVAAAAVLSRVAAELVEGYGPGQAALLARVGPPRIELEGVAGGVYALRVELRVANLGTEPVEAGGGEVVVLVRSAARGRAVTVSCRLLGPLPISVPPGGVTTIAARCQLSGDALESLFGTPHPRGDLVERSTTFLYLRLELSTAGAEPGSEEIVVT